MTLDRRKFLRIAGIAAVAGALSACEPLTQPVNKGTSKKKHDAECYRRRNELWQCKTEAHTGHRGVIYGWCPAYAHMKKHPTHDVVLLKG